MSAASTITTSAGDLTLTADANNAKTVIKGDHESDVAIRQDGNADAASIMISMQANQILMLWSVLLILMQLVLLPTISYGAASTITTSAGDLTLTADANNAKGVIKGDHESDVAIKGDHESDVAIDVMGQQILMLVLLQLRRVLRHSGCY